MDKKPYIIILLFIIGMVAIVFISHDRYSVTYVDRPVYADEEKFFLNHQCEDLGCIGDKFTICNVGEYAKNGIRVAIYGPVDDRCHVMTNKYDCYLYQTDLTIPVLNQIIGNQENLEYIIHYYCKSI